MNPEQMIIELHGKWEQPPSRVNMPERDRQFYRLEMLREEVDELEDAINRTDMVAIADALGDIGHVLFGTAFVYGIPLIEVMAEIHRSNMTKEINVKEKLIKGPDYSPPELTPILEKHGWDGS